MTDHSILTPRSTFLADAERVLAEKYRLMARVIELESTLSDCLHHMAAQHGIPTDDPEPECVNRAKLLLGWGLG